MSVRRYLGGGFERLDQAEARNRLFDQTLTCDTPDCAWVYTHPLDPGSEVVFTFQDERIKRIDWYIYTD